MCRLEEEKNTQTNGKKNTNDFRKARSWRRNGSKRVFFQGDIMKNCFYGFSDGL